MSIHLENQIDEAFAGKGWPEGKDAPVLLQEAARELKHLRAYQQQMNGILIENAALRKELTAARLERDEERKRLLWLECHIFNRRWMLPIGSPFTWEVVGSFRHALRAMRGGETLVEAIDIASKVYSK